MLKGLTNVIGQWMAVVRLGQWNRNLVGGLLSLYIQWDPRKSPPSILASGLLLINQASEWLLIYEASEWLYFSL